MASFLQDLKQQFPIVDPKTGCPTPYFMRLLQGQGTTLGGDIDSNTAAIALKADKTTQIIAGAGLAGGGTLAADRTLDVGTASSSRIIVNADNIDLATTAVTPGSYTNTNLIVDAYGRLTAASSGSTASGTSWTLVGPTGVAASAQTVTITIASPGVVTLNSHGFTADLPVVLATSGALPTGLTAGTTYYVRNPATNTFELSATAGGASINTTGSQSGTHTVTRRATATCSAASQVDVTGLSSYNELLIIALDLTASSTGTRNIRVSTDNGSTFYSASGDYRAIDGTGVAAATTSLAFHSTNSTAARTLACHIVNTKGAVKFAHFYHSNNIQGLFVASASDINAVRVFNTAGTISGGPVYVLGR